MGSMKRRYVIVLMVALLGIGLTSGTASGGLKGMTGHWAASLVSALEAKGFVNGDELGRFDPDASLTRAQLAKLVVLGMGLDEEAQLLARYPSRFADVPLWHWGKGYIESLAETGVTTGYTNDLFGPNDPVTRAQLAVFLVRAAGLSDQTSDLTSSSPYTDEAEIPSWARNEVVLATQRGLITGFPDNTFRPMQTVTRAEATAVLLRLLNLKGTAFNLTGTLMRLDPESLTGVVRDNLGQDHTFTMASEAQYFRNGSPATAYAMRELDQVWILLGDDGLGRFMEARYKDMTVEKIQIAGAEAVVTTGAGLKLLPVEPYAVAYLNGRAVSLSEVSGAGPAYALLDASTGGIRLIDAINAPLAGEFLGVRESGTSFVVVVDDHDEEYALAPDARIFLNGRPVSINQLTTGDRVRLAVDETGKVTYLQAER